MNQSGREMPGIKSIPRLTCITRAWTFFNVDYFCYSKKVRRLQTRKLLLVRRYNVRPTTYSTARLHGKCQSLKGRPDGHTLANWKNVTLQQGRIEYNYFFRALVDAKVSLRKEQFWKIAFKDELSHNFT